MTEAGPYPFLPEVYYWFVFERDSSRHRVGWPRMKVEALSPGAPEIADQVMAALDAAEKDNRVAAPDFISAMEQQGFTFVDRALSTFVRARCFGRPACSSVCRDAQTIGERQSSPGGAVKRQRRAIRSGQNGPMQHWRPVPVLRQPGCSATQALRHS